MEGRERVKFFGRILPSARRATSFVFRRSSPRAPSQSAVATAPHTRVPTHTTSARLSPSSPPTFQAVERRALKLFDRDVPARRLPIHTQAGRVGGRGGGDAGRGGLGAGERGGLGAGRLGREPRHLKLGGGGGGGRAATAAETARVCACVLGRCPGRRCRQCGRAQRGGRGWARVVFSKSGFDGSVLQCCLPFFLLPRVRDTALRRPRVCALASCIPAVC